MIFTNLHYYNNQDARKVDMTVGLLCSALTHIDVSHQFACIGIVGGRANVYPCAVDGEIGDLEPVGKSLIDKVGGIGATIGRERSEQSVGYHIDAGIGII